MSSNLTDDEFSSLAKIPKADLHIHLEGTVDHVLLNELATDAKIDLHTPTILQFPNLQPFPVPPPNTKILSEPFSGSFLDFISLYVKISSTLRSAEILTKVATRYVESAIKEGVIAADIYVTPTTLIALGLPEEDLWVGLLEAERVVKNRFNFSIRWIFDIVRNSPLSGSETLELATRARDRGISVPYIGFAGHEAGFPAAPFAAVFEQAVSLGFTTLAHAGETAGAKSIEDALLHINPARIGHGVRAVESPALLEKLKITQLPIEVCPWSNVALRVFDETTHPIRTLIEAGLNVVICSDDPGIFGKSLLDNYRFAATKGVSFKTLEKIAARSLELSTAN